MRADAELPSKRSLRVPIGNSPSQLGRPRGCQRRLPAAVLPFPPGDRNSLTLALADQLSLELSKRPHDTQQQIRHGRILAGEGQLFLHKDDMNAPLRQTQHYSPQVIKVAGQPVHLVTEHCVAFADEALHGLQWGTLYILAGAGVTHEIPG